MPRALAVVAVALLAGCAAPPPGSDGARDLVLGTLQANGNAGVRFMPRSPVLELSDAYFSLREGAREVTVHNDAVAIGRALLKLDGFGDAGWALLVSHRADLRVERGDANASFVLVLSPEQFALEQLDTENPAGACRGNATYISGRHPLGEGGGLWTTRVSPGGNATIELDGPPPCDGLRFAYTHRGTWTARSSP